MVTVEICAQSYQAAINAYQGGAHRIELCADLPTGGLTPAWEVVKKVCTEITIPVYVLIRPRIGDFVYTRQEIHSMQLDILKSLDAGASGIVCGALTHDNRIDADALALLVKTCEGKSFTFHRAFEKIDFQHEAIQHLMSIGGISRILTGGKSGNAYHSREELKSLNDLLAGRIILLAGSGVTSKNAAIIVQDAGVNEIHASAKYQILTAIEAERLNLYDSDPAEVIRIMAAVKDL